VQITGGYVRTGDSKTHGWRLATRAHGRTGLRRCFPARRRSIASCCNRATSPRVHKLISTLTAKIVRNASAGCSARSPVDYNPRLSAGLSATSHSGRINETGATGDNNILDICAIRPYVRWCHVTVKPRPCHRPTTCVANRHLDYGKPTKQNIRHQLENCNHKQQSLLTVTISTFNTSPGLKYIGLIIM